MENRPYQYPIQVGSLTTNISEQSDMLMRSDNVEGGKPQGNTKGGLWLAPKALCGNAELTDCKTPKGEVTLSQSNRQGKDADRRSTNYVSIVKVNQIKNWMSGDWKGRATVLLAKPDTSGEEMGKGTQRPSRCKSRRYAFKRQPLSNWGDPVKSRKGKERYKVADPLKFNPVLNRESEMTIVAIESGDSKTPESEGSLAYSGLLGGRSV